MFDFVTVFSIHRPDYAAMRRVIGGAVVAVSVLIAPSAFSATYQVGPSRTYQQLGSVPTLRAGDVVEVDGDATYDPIVFGDSGSSAAKITIRGIRVNGRRPVISGGSNTVEFRGHHYVFEGFDITGGSPRCVFHHANDILIRDSVIHDCPTFGLVGAEDDSGSLTLEYVELHHNSNDASVFNHQIYMASDQNAFPGSVFRMQHCYVHDGLGGNGIKSRAERNELYYNWIEGSYFHEVELIGPSDSAGSIREDSDVVGNVIRKTGPHPTHFAIRVGGDGAGQTFGRYRFANNTILLAPDSAAVFRIFNGIETLEMHNNVIFRVGGGGVQVAVEDSVTWASGSPLLSGTNNWIPSGSTSVPAGLSNTISGSDPRLVAVPSDLSPEAGGPLVGAGRPAPAGIAGHELPRPLVAPEYLPPARALEAPGSARARRVAGTIDIGAFERASDGGSTNAGAGASSADAANGSGGCTVAGAQSPLCLSAAGMLLVGATLLRGRPRGSRARARGARRMP